MKYLRTVEEAQERLCPFEFETEAHCAADKCMAWVEAESRVTREDHSGAAQMMNELAMKRNTLARREGPAGCSGTLILDARGYCARIGKLTKEED